MDEHDREVWVRLYSALLAAGSGSWGNPKAAAEEADKALEEYRKRFPYRAPYR